MHDLVLLQSLFVPRPANRVRFLDGKVIPAAAGVPGRNDPAVPGGGHCCGGTLQIKRQQPTTSSPYRERFRAASERVA